MNNPNNFHLSEHDFNRLDNRSRLKYILDRFYVGMDVCVKIGKKPGFESKIFGFYDYSNGNIGNIVKDMESFNTMPDINKKIPSVNIWLMIDDELSGIYPLWVQPNFAKIRNDKLEKIGI